MSDVKPTRDEINALRLKAFATNSHDDRMAYYKACSGWFQDEDHRELERAYEITALRARLEAVEKERDNETIKRAGWELEARIAEARAERAEAALATARRDAWQTVLDNIREWAWPEDGTYPPEDRAIQDAERGTVEFIESQIRALADEAPE